MDQRDRAAVQRIEQQHPALMRLLAVQAVGGIVADDLRAEQVGPAHRAGHHAERAAIVERQYLAQQLPRLPGRQRDHCVAHDRDARRHRQQAAGSPHRSRAATCRPPYFRSCVCQL
jgi:hypothetical protein